MKMTLDSQAFGAFRPRLAGTIVTIAAAGACAAAAVAVAAVMEICAVQYYGGHAA